jgi:hypothetical protein
MTSTEFFNTVTQDQIDNPDFSYFASDCKGFETEQGEFFLIHENERCFKVASETDMDELVRSIDRQETLALLQVNQEHAEIDKWISKQ